MADKELSALTAAGALGGTETLYLVDASGNSRKIALSDLKTFINTDPSVVPSSVPWLGARVYRTADLSISNNTATAVTWQAAESISASGVWSSGAPTRLTTLTGWTKVRLRACVRWAGNATGVRASNFLKNGSSFRGSGMFFGNAAGTTEPAAIIESGVISVTGGTDYFELSAFQNSGGALNLEGLTRQEYNWFEIEAVEAS